MEENKPFIDWRLSQSLTCLEAPSLIVCQSNILTQFGHQISWPSFTQYHVWHSFSRHWWCRSSFRHKVHGTDWRRSSFHSQAHDADGTESSHCQTQPPRHKLHRPSRRKPMAQMAQMNLWDSIWNAWSRWTDHLARHNFHGTDAQIIPNPTAQMAQIILPDTRFTA